MSGIKKRRNKRQMEFIADNNRRVSEENFLSAVIDKESKQIRIYTNDMLTKRMHRDSRKIAKSFDKLCNDELLEINKMYSESIYLIGDGFVRATKEDSQIKIISGKLLMNASHTIQASVELLRLGYILQPGMLLRSVVETFCTVSYFILEAEGLQKYIDGKLDVNKTIIYGKKVVPPIGRFQGMLSNKFVHIGQLHGDFNFIIDYKEMSNPLRINLNLIKVAIWLVYVIGELVYYDYFSQHKYWVKIDVNKYEFEQNDETKEWMDIFIN